MEDEEDEEEELGGGRKKNPGRRKIDIEYIHDKGKRVRSWFSWLIDLHTFRDCFYHPL